MKWYPHPILAPYYELTVQHTKEPLYLTAKKLRKWLEASGVLAPKPVEHHEPLPTLKKTSSKKTTAVSQSGQVQKVLWAEGE